MGFMHKFPHSRMFDSDLREIIEMYLTVKDLPDKWVAFEKLVSGEVEDLKNFVNNYFDNLNVQNEINNKLDAMAKDGSLSALIQPLFNAYKAEINSDINILKNRMNTFTSLTDGSTTGDAELIDGRTDYKGNTHINIGEHIRGVTSELSGEIEKVKNGAGLTEVITYELVTDGLVTLSGYGITKISDTKWTIEPSDFGTVIGYPVSEGQHIQIFGSTFYQNYTALGYVWATDTNTPEVWNNSNAKDMLPFGENDYYMGSTNETAWQERTIELTVPHGAEMIWVRGNGNFQKICIGKVEYAQDSSVDSSEKTNKTVYEIESEPIVTTGTVTKQSVYSKENRECYLWEFSEVGSITLNNVQINAKNTDRVGIWLYINEEALTYGNNTDGVAKIYIDGVVYNNYFPLAYEMVAGWNYVNLGITDNYVHTIKIDFTMVRGNYKLAIDTIELNYKTRPQILLSFDAPIHNAGNIATDNRFTLLNERGFRATFCNPDGFNNETNTKEQLNFLLSKGWDWGLYGGTGTRPNYDSGTLEDWKSYLQTSISACEEIGLFNPISYFSPENRGSVVLEKALKEVGYKVARIAGADYKINWFDDKNGLYIACVGVGANDTAEEIIAKIDDAIENNASICVFTHVVEDTVTADYNCSKAVYSAVLDAIKTRVDNGLCDVVTFREFYNHWCPEGYAELMQNRHEKEKQYILSKII